MKDEINLHILGLKNYSTEKLKEIEIELEKIKIEFGTFLYEPIEKLKRKIRIEQNKRSRRNWVWVEFSCSWSGYSNNLSAPRRDVGKHYRKINKEIAEKMPKYYCHTFSDNSTNDWYIKIVDTKKEDNNLYREQIDKFLIMNNII